MSYNDDDWINYGLEELTRVESPPPDSSLQFNDPSLDNIPMDDVGYSPRGDLHDLQYSNDLSVPLGDFQFGNEDRLSPNGGAYQPMQPMASMNLYDGPPQPTEYNSFEQPTMVVNDPFEMEDQYMPQACSPSTSQVMGGVASTSYDMVQQDSMMQQHPTPSKKSGSKSSSSRKKPQATNSVGQMLAKNNRMPMAPQLPVGNQQETRLSVEEAMRTAQLMSEMQRLRTEMAATGIDHTDEINRLEQEFTAIFLQNLSQSQSVNKDILKEVTIKSQHPPVLPVRKAPPALQHKRQVNKYGQPIVSHNDYQPQVVYQPQPTTSTAVPTSSGNQFIQGSNGQLYQVIPQGQQQSGTQTIQIQPARQQDQFRGQQVVYQQPQQQVISSHNQQVVQQFPPGTIYVQSTSNQQQMDGPPRLQPVHKQIFVSNSGQQQQTLGDMVRQQHQLRQQQGGLLPVHQQNHHHQPQMIITSASSSSTSRSASFKTAQVMARRAPIMNNGMPSPRGANSVTLHHLPPGQQPLLVRQLDQPPVLTMQKFEQHQPQPILIHQQPFVEKILVPKQSLEELEAMAAFKANERKQNMDTFIQMQVEQMVHPETEKPFSSMRDVVMRLLPYHIHYEPDFSQEALDDFDDNWLRECINIDTKMKNLNKKMCSVMLRDAMKSTENMELDLLLYLDTEYERRKLEMDKKEAAKNLEKFVASRDVSKRKIDDKMLQAKPVTALHPHFEYHEFDETVREPSPYFSPPPRLSPARNMISPPLKIKSRRSSIVHTQTTALNTPPGIPPSPIPATPSSRATKERRAHQPTEKDSARQPLVPPVLQTFSGKKAEFKKPNNREHSNFPRAALPSSTQQGDDSDGSVSPELGFDGQFLAPKKEELKRKMPIPPALPVRKHPPLSPIRLKTLLSKKEELERTAEMRQPSVEPVKLAPLKLKIKLGGTVIVNDVKTDETEKKHKDKKKKHKHKKHKKEKKKARKEAELREQQLAKKEETPSTSLMPPPSIIQNDLETPQLRKPPPIPRNGQTPRRIVEIYESPQEQGRLKMRLSLGPPRASSFQTPLPKQRLTVPASETRLKLKISYGRTPATNRVQIIEVPDPSRSCPIPAKKPRMATVSDGPKPLNGCENTPTISGNSISSSSGVGSLVTKLKRPLPPLLPPPMLPRKEDKKKVVPKKDPQTAAPPPPPQTPVLNNGRVDSVGYLTPLVVSNVASQEPVSRPSSSMSFLLGDDRSAGSYNFLKSPDEKESLPAIQFSDDEMDDEVHTELRIATDRAFADQKPANNTIAKTSLFPLTKLP